MIDTVKAVITYITAAITALGGMASIIYIGKDPAQSDTKTIIAGFVGGAFIFLFNQEVQTRTARQTNMATAQGVLSQTNGTSTNAQGALTTHDSNPETH